MASWASGSSSKPKHASTFVELYMSPLLKSLWNILHGFQDRRPDPSRTEVNKKLSLLSCFGSDLAVGFLSITTGSIPRCSSKLARLAGTTATLPKEWGLSKPSFSLVCRLWQNVDFPYRYWSALRSVGDLGMGWCFLRCLSTPCWRDGWTSSQATVSAWLYGLRKGRLLWLGSCFLRTYTQHGVGHSCAQLSFSSQGQQSNLQYAGALQGR